jgi:Protein of unknown function (DUF1353)
MRVEFKTPLRVERVSEDDWIVIAPLWAVVADLRGGLDIVVPNGFVTDFASVPRLPLVFLATADLAERSAVLHDYLYRSGVVSRARADAIFRAGMLAEDVAGWRRWLMWAAVRGFGARHYRARGV